MEAKNIKELKKELNINNADIAKCFDMSYNSFANSTAKERYENALLSFYKLAKKGWEKNKRKNLISNDQKIKHDPKPLIIHGVMCSLNLAEIENLVILKHYDDSDFGWNKQACEEMREESRKAVGYTKADLENYT